MIVHWTTTSSSKKYFYDYLYKKNLFQYFIHSKILKHVGLLRYNVLQPTNGFIKHIRAIIISRHPMNFEIEFVDWIFFYLIASFFYDGVIKMIDS